MDISTLSNYFELYGGMAIFLVVLLEYMNLPGFLAGIIMPLAGIYAAHGGLSLFLAIAISIPAGVLKMEFVKYSIASFLGITLWNTIFVGVGYIIGEPVLNIITRG